jgi:catalase
MNDKDRQHLIQNIAGNLRNAKSAEIKARQRKFFFVILSEFLLKTLIDAFSVSVFAAVDQGLSDAIATAIGAPTARPLTVAPATEVVPLRTNIGQNTVSIA